MNGPEEQFPSSFSREQVEQASQWVARHERGLSRAETRAFEQWLSEAPNNEACFFEHQVAWSSFDVLDEWRPTFSSAPNPDLFETKPKRNWIRFLPLAGLAAVVLLGFYLLQIFQPKTKESEDIVTVTYKAQSNEKHFLEDGSSFYLLPGSEVRVAFSKSERTVEFVSGEAEFEVAHDQNRPFVVHSEVGRVTALGTIFSVRKDSNSWEVYVTEGRVKVDEVEDNETVASENEAYSAELVAGQVMVEELSDEEFSPKIEVISADELEERLAWKDQIIDMVSAPLEEILREFSQFNEGNVIIYDEELKQMRMTVAIKRDNFKDFIDLLELSSDVKATDTPTGSIVLTRFSN